MDSYSDVVYVELRGAVYIRVVVGDEQVVDEIKKYYFKKK